MLTIVPKFMCNLYEAVGTVLLILTVLNILPSAHDGVKMK